MPREIYLDANATTPVLPAAPASAQHVMETLYGNPSSTHYAGLKAQDMLANVRARATRVLGAGDGRIVFVSGATEAIQTAVLSALCAVRERRAQGHPTGRLLLFGATEHKAVPESLAHWNQVLGLGLEIRALPVNMEGQHNLATLRLLAADAALLCTMAANNETGVVSDLTAIGSVLDQTGSRALWLVDCVQALGKLPLHLADTRIDYAAFSGHKLYAPKGVGMLYVRAQTPFTALMAGGGQEGGQRSGTENMAGIAALGAVLKALEEGNTFRSHNALRVLRDRLVESLRAALPEVVFNAPLEKTLPTTLNFSVPGFSSKELLDLFDAAAIRVSSGSACSAAQAAPSYVLQAMGLPAWRAASAVRMSFGPATDDAFIALACARIADCGAALRASGLTRSARAVQPAEGVLQFSAEGANSWLVLDPASRHCVVVDPLPELLGRLHTCIDNQNLQVLAVVCSSADPSRVSARQALVQRLEQCLPSRIGTCDTTGWPAGCGAIRLADGSPANALHIGRQCFAQLALPDSMVHLLGQAEAGCLPAEAVRFAFCGDALLAGSDCDPVRRPRSPMAQLALDRLVPVLHPDTVLCQAADPHGRIADTFQAALAPASHRDQTAACMHLDAKALEAFLSEHANTRLIDVRETFEHLVSPPPTWWGRVPELVPLSCLVNHLGGWLQDCQTPLVFICRSGGRSARTAACLRRLGHPNAWHLAGGLANSLAPPAAVLGNKETADEPAFT